MATRFVRFQNTTTTGSSDPPFTITPSSTTLGVPTPILTPVTTGPPTAPAPHSSIPTYSDTGSLLVGYCASTEYVLLDGLSTAFWVPAVGCVGGKTDCCPYSVTSTASIAIIIVDPTSTVTVSVDASGANSPFAGVQGYPTPASSNLATLLQCPGGYVSVSGGCCPSGYNLWNSLLGGATPCYSSLSSTLVPPTLPVTSMNRISAPTTISTTPSKTANQTPTSAIVNIVYAVHFTLQPSPGLSSGAQAGIGVGAGVAGIAIFALIGFFLWRTKKRKKAESRLNAMQQTPAQHGNSNARSQSGATAISSPYAYSKLTARQTGGAPGPQMQDPGGFVPTNQGGYFSPEVRQGQPSRYYGQQPTQQMPLLQQDVPYEEEQMPQVQQRAAQGYYRNQPG